MFAIGAAIAVPSAFARKDRPARDTPVTGPAADYPVVLGQPFTVDGKTYTPADTMNYDAVGYASQDDEGADVTASHRTLPLPSYIEVTSLASGRTILARVTRRGPMSGNFVVGLSAGAWRQLGLEPGSRAAVRVRRVNPPEAERALLRLGRTAPERMETPPGLLNVLRRRLGDSEDALLSGPAQPAPKEGGSSATEVSGPALAPAPATSTSPPARPPAKPEPTAKATPAPVAAPLPKVAAEKPKAPAAPAPAPVARPASSSRPTPAPVFAPPAKAERTIVQVAAMSTQARAQAAAKEVGGTVARSGKYWRVQIGPFAEPAAADAALAKARAAGYADARVLHER